MSGPGDRKRRTGMSKAFSWVNCFRKSKKKRRQSAALNVAPSPESSHHTDIPDVPALPADAHASSTALAEFNRLSIGSIANEDGSLQLDGISSPRSIFDIDETAPDYVPTYTEPPKGGMVGDFITGREYGTRHLFSFNNPFTNRPVSFCRKTVMSTITEVKEEDEEEEDKNSDSDSNFDADSDTDSDSDSDPAPAKPAADHPYMSARQKFQNTGETMRKSASMGYISPLSRKSLIPKVPRSPTAGPTFIIPRKPVTGSSPLASCAVNADDFTVSVGGDIIAGPSTAAACNFPAVAVMPQGFTYRGRRVDYASIDAALGKSGGMRRSRTSRNLARLAAENAMGKSFSFPAMSADFDAANNDGNATHSVDGEDGGKGKGKGKEKAVDAGSNSDSDSDSDAESDDDEKKDKASGDSN
ncbi:hypothetical protein BZA77DRAFT_358260 [Pyronema omphalodes]|nr:hypothetical protein BZA77DRAFT_358260 [Pyronema omphalodes]